MEQKLCDLSNIQFDVLENRTKGIIESIATVHSSRHTDTITYLVSSLIPTLKALGQLFEICISAL